MLSGLNLFFNNNNFLIDVLFKVIFLGLNILGAAMDLLLAAFRGVSLWKSARAYWLFCYKDKFLHSVHTSSCCVNGEQTDFELETPLKNLFSPYRLLSKSYFQPSEGYRTFPSCNARLDVDTLVFLAWRFPGMSKSRMDNTQLYLPRCFSTITRDATLFQEGNVLPTPRSKILCWQR